MRFDTDLSDLRKQYESDLENACAPIFAAMQTQFEQETQNYIDSLNNKYKRHHFVLCDVMGQIGLNMYKKTGKNAGKLIIYAIEGESYCFDGGCLSMGEFRDLRDTNLAKELQNPL
jgi:hypothetical protein